MSNKYRKEYIKVKADLLSDPESSHLAEAMKDICDYFIEQNKPKSFGIENNVIIRSEKEFEHVCANLEESGIKSKLTVFSFYSRIEHVEKRYQELKQRNHGIKNS